MRCLAELLRRVKVRFVDFHAELTSEKMAMGWYLDGRVSAVIGTHTHIPTADTRILPNGTAYQTDVGMTGPYHSVIGVDKDIILQKFLTQMPVRMEAARHGAELHAVIVEVDESTGRARRADPAIHCVLTWRHVSNKPASASCAKCARWNRQNRFRSLEARAAFSPNRSRPIATILRSPARLAMGSPFAPPICPASCS